MDTASCKRRFCFHGFTLDEGARSLCRNGTSIPLAPKEFDTLVLLVHSAGQAVGKQELMNAIWPETYVGENSLTKNISVLRKRLGTDAIETLSKHGYRFAWEVGDVLPGEQNTVPQSEAHVEEIRAELSPVPQSTQQSRHFPIKVLILGIVTVAALLGAGSVVWRSPRREATGEPVLRIAVLPLNSLTGSPDTDYLRDGIAEELITALGEVNPDRLQVLSRDSSALYLKTNKRPAIIAHELGVQFLLESTLWSDNSKLQLIVHLIRGGDETVLWTGKFVRPLRDIQVVETEITEAVSREVRIKILPDDAHDFHAGTLDPVAHSDYLHGLADLELRTKPAFEDALAQFRNATVLDPDYARSWAGIAETYVYLAEDSPEKSAYANAKEFANRAVELDPRLGDPHRVLGFALFNDDSDLEGSEREYKQALLLNPGDALTHHWYSQLLMAEKRKEEALREVRAGLTLDPLSLGSNYNYAFMLIDAGRVQEGINHLHKLIERVPDSEVVYGYLGIGYSRLHDYARAQQAFERARDLSSLKYQYQTAVAFCLAKQGERQRAREIMLDLQSKADHGQWIPSENMALGYIGLGERELALRWLQKAVERHEVTLLEVNYEPLTELAGDPRFDKITCPLRGKTDPCVARVRQ